MHHADGYLGPEFNLGFCFAANDRANMRLVDADDAILDVMDAQRIHQALLAVQLPDDDSSCLDCRLLGAVNGVIDADSSMMRRPRRMKPSCLPIPRRNARNPIRRCLARVRYARRAFSRYVRGKEN